MISEVSRGCANLLSGLIQPQMMKKLSGYLFLSLIAGSWHSVKSETKEPNLSHFQTIRNARYCFDTSSRKICITKFLANIRHPQFCRCFVTADPCKRKIAAKFDTNEDETDLGAILFKAPPTQHEPAGDIPGRDFSDETCMESNDESSSSDNCYDSISSLLRYICPHSEETKPDTLSTEVTTCMNSTTDEMQASTLEDFKSSSHPPPKPDAHATETISNEKMQSSTPKDFKSPSYPPSNASSMLTTHTTAIHDITYKNSGDEELSQASNSKDILLITFLFVAVIFIVVAVILVIRRRKLRNNGSPKTNTQQGEAVLSAYASVAPDNRPLEGTVQHSTSIYVDVEMVQRSIPSSSATNASVQPTGVYEELDFPPQQKPNNPDNITTYISPVYSQPFEPPTSTSNTLYAEPFKPDEMSTAYIQGHNTAAGQNIYSLEKAIPMGYPKAIYSEPKKSAEKSAENVQSQHSAVDQKNIYSLEKAIPMGDPSAIYSEPNKPSKSPGIVDEREQAAGPVCLETIQKKPGAGSGDVPTLDPSAVYAKPMKLENSSEVLPLKKANQNNEAIIGDKRSSDDIRPVYTEFELTKQPKPSHTNIYDNFKPTEEAVDTSVVYANPQV